MPSMDFDNIPELEHVDEGPSILPLVLFLFIIGIITCVLIK
jgi:hypothetical protein